jgi:hypothetical protein
MWQIRPTVLVLITYRVAVAALMQAKLTDIFLGISVHCVVARWQQNAAGTVDSY